MSTTFSATETALQASPLLSLSVSPANMTMEQRMNLVSECQKLLRLVNHSVVNTEKQERELCFHIAKHLALRRGEQPDRAPCGPAYLAWPCAHSHLGDTNLVKDGAEVGPTHPEHPWRSDGGGDDGDALVSTRVASTGTRQVWSRVGRVL